LAEIAPKETDRETLKALTRRGAQLIDVRAREEFERLHLPGAASIPLSMISRSTADRLQWDKAVIVYSQGCLCDLSARAAWRLASLGFTQVFRYKAGLEDWLANGFPIEGSEAQAETAADVADMDIPTCKRGEKVGEVRTKVKELGWDTCAVVNEALVVLGILRAVDLEKADQRWSAEEAMERDPQTFRLNARPEEIEAYFHSNPAVSSVLVTTPEGNLFGLIRRPPR
jgi:rhodanese-related sulfurtransferase